jgi:NAD(P)-dependent dehydrogenase (short-subunit alcohol dehydrogenase family)
MGDRLKDKVAVITGGACGIGEGAARRFVEEGASVVVSDLQVEAGEALVSELGPAARFIRTDVTREEDVAAAVDLAVSEFGRLDCMVNNAGIVGVIGSIKDTSAEAWDFTIAVLLRGVFLGMKHAARVMIPQESGSIISLASTAGVAGGLGSHAYTAAKHGVVGLTKSAASELGQHGIRVNAVAPGNIVTPMTADVVSGNHTDLATAHDHIETTSPLHRAGLPVDIANVALFLASDEAAYVTGQTLVADAGQTSSGRVSRFSSAKPSEVLEAGRRRHTSGS